MSLRVGLLNMMPDRAFKVSERQFSTLLGSRDHGPIVLERFTFDAFSREASVQARIDAGYRPLASLPGLGLDVLVITGANVSDPELSRQVFWPPLVELFRWAESADVPTLCSCLATHALLEARYGIRRSPVVPKVWGVFAQQQALPGHPLLAGLADEVPVPHSRHNEVSAGQFAAAGYDVLLAGGAGGVHLAVERTRGRWLLMQGHPEYDTVSLLKEYKREVGAWLNGQRPDHPPLPEGYLTPTAATMLAAYRAECEESRIARVVPPPFPEEEVVARIANAWTAPAVTTVRNWLRSLDLA